MRKKLAAADLLLHSPQDAMNMMNRIVSDENMLPELIRTYAAGISAWLACWQAADPTTRDTATQLDNNRIDALVTAILATTKSNQESGDPLQWASEESEQVRKYAGLTT